jgi:hypothetical protein
LLTSSINAVVSLVAQHLSESLAYICFAPINVKPEKIVKGTSRTVPAKDVQLVLGHLANHLAEALSFGGIGVNCKCRGAVVTLVSVEILELELLNMGTKKMELKRSGAYPLFDDMTISRFLGSSKKKGKTIQGQACFRQSKQWLRYLPV